MLSGDDKLIASIRALERQRIAPRPLGHSRRQRLDEAEKEDIRTEYFKKHRSLAGQHGPLSSRKRKLCGVLGKSSTDSEPLVDRKGLVEWMCEDTYAQNPWYALFGGLTFVNSFVEDEYITQCFVDRSASAFGVSIPLWVSALLALIGLTRETFDFTTIHTNLSWKRDQSWWPSFIALVMIHGAIAASLLLGTTHMFLTSVIRDRQSGGRIGDGKTAVDEAGTDISALRAVRSNIMRSHLMPSGLSKHFVRYARYSEMACIILISSISIAGIMSLADDQFRCHVNESRAASIITGEASPFPGYFYAPSNLSNATELQNVLYFTQSTIPALRTNSSTWNSYNLERIFGSEMVLCQYEWRSFLGVACVFIPLLLQQGGPRFAFSWPIVLVNSLFLIVLLATAPGYNSETDNVSGLAHLPSAVNRYSSLPTVASCVCCVVFAQISFFILRLSSETAERRRFKLFCVTRERRRRLHLRNTEVGRIVSALAAPSLFARMNSPTSTAAAPPSAQRSRPDSHQSSVISPFPFVEVRAACAAIEILNSVWGPCTAPESAMKLIAAVRDMLTELIMRQRACGDFMGDKSELLTMDGRPEPKGWAVQMLPVLGDTYFLFIKDEAAQCDARLGKKSTASLALLNICLEATRSISFAKQEDADAVLAPGARLRAGLHCGTVEVGSIWNGAPVVPTHYGYPLPTIHDNSGWGPGLAGAKAVLATSGPGEVVASNSFVQSLGDLPAIEARLGLNVMASGVSVPFLNTGEALSIISRKASSNLPARSINSYNLAASVELATSLHTHVLPTPRCVHLKRHGGGLAKVAEIAQQVGFRPPSESPLRQDAQQAPATRRSFPIIGETEYLFLNNMWSGPESNVVSTTSPQHVASRFQGQSSSHDARAFHPQHNPLTPQHSGGAGLGPGGVISMFNRSYSSSAGVTNSPRLLPLPSLAPAAGRPNEASAGENVKDWETDSEDEVDLWPFPNLETGKRRVDELKLPMGAIVNPIQLNPWKGPLGPAVVNRASSDEALTVRGRLIQRFASMQSESEWMRWCAVLNTVEASAVLACRGLWGLFVLLMAILSSSQRLIALTPLEFSDTLQLKTLSVSEAIAHDSSTYWLVMCSPIISVLGLVYCSVWQSERARLSVETPPGNVVHRFVGGVAGRIGRVSFRAHSIFLLLIFVAESAAVIGGSALLNQGLWGNAIAGWISVLVLIFTSSGGGGLFPIAFLIAFDGSKDNAADGRVESSQSLVAGVAVKAGQRSGSEGMRKHSFASKVASTLLCHFGTVVCVAAICAQLILSFITNDADRRGATEKRVVASVVDGVVTLVDLTNLLTVSVEKFIRGELWASSFDTPRRFMCIAACMCFSFLIIVAVPMAESVRRALRRHYAMVLKLFVTNVSTRVEESNTLRRFITAFPPPLQTVFLQHALFLCDTKNDHQNQSRKLSAVRKIIRFENKYPTTAGGIVAADSVGLPLPRPTNVTAIPFYRSDGNTIVVMMRAGFADRSSRPESSKNSLLLTMSRLLHAVESRLVTTSEFYLATTAKFPTASSLSMLKEVRGKKTEEKKTAHGTPTNAESPPHFVGEPSPEELASFLAQLDRKDMYKSVRSGAAIPTALLQRHQREQHAMAMHAPLSVISVVGDTVTIAGPLQPNERLCLMEQKVEDVPAYLSLAAIFFLKSVEKAIDSPAAPLPIVLSSAMCCGPIGSGLLVSAAPWCLPTRRTVSTCVTTGAPPLVAKDLLSTLPLNAATHHHLIARNVCTAANVAAMDAAERVKSMPSVTEADVATCACVPSAAELPNGIKLSPVERIARAQLDCTQLLQSISMLNSEVRGVRNGAAIEVHPCTFVDVADL